ncbi:MAG: extracellular solute-binding protein [Streptosporangiales bacterium]|nr:extracellular solute-binding protein [Streptosporangiales bacterium]
MTTRIGSTGPRPTARTRRGARTRGAVAGLVACASVLSGCGFVNTGGEEQPEGKLTAYVNTEVNAGLKSFFAAYEKSSGVTVDASAAATDELNRQLRVQLTSGTAADVIRVSPGYSSPVAVGTLGTDGELADVSAEPWTKSLPSDARPLADVNGKTMAFPVSRNAIVMAYNKKAFAKAKVDVPTTWPEFLAANHRLRKAGMTPIAAPLQGGVYLQFWMYALAATLVYADNPDIDEQLKAGKTNLVDDEGWREVFAKFLELRDAGYFSEGALGVPPEQGMQSVATGESAMILMVSAGLPQLHGYAEGGADDIGVFALPATDDADETFVPIAPEFLAVNAASKNADNAKAFLRFLARKDNVAKYANTNGVLPGLDVGAKLESTTLDPIMPLLEKRRTAPFANYLWPNGSTQQTLLQSGQDLYDKKLTTRQLLTQLDAEYDKGTP